MFVFELECSCSSDKYPEVKLLGSLLLFSHLVASNSCGPHKLQHARLPCPSLFPRVCSNSCPLSWWCHPTISSSVIPFFSCLQSFPASGFLDLHYLPESAQTHVHWVDDAIQQSHPLLPSSPLALSLPQHQGLFQWVNSASGATILELQLQHQSFQWVFGVDFLLGLTDLTSLLSRGLSRNKWN